MLSIGKLAAGQEAYYERSVAEGVDDYYSGKGESPGRWAGEGARSIGLQGTVREGELTALVAGLHPVSKDTLRARKAGKVAAFDLTFSAPKSVSVTWALTDDPDLKANLAAAHDLAVDAALKYVEETAMFVRRGAGGFSFEPAGIVVAEYRHRMSRAQDPQLHTHCVTPNYARGLDGRWTALHHPTMYRAAQTAGFLYQAHLRHEVHERTGLQWGAVRNGTADLTVIPDAVRNEFSRRTKEIQELAEKHGTHLGGPAAGNKTVLASRQRKEPVDMPVWLEQVADRAAEHGLTRDDLAESLHREAGSPAGVPAGTDDHLVTKDGLTEKRTSFGTRPVLRALASAAEQGAPVETLRAHGERFVQRADVLRIVDRDGNPRWEWSTQEMTDVERGLITGAAGRAGEGVGIVSQQNLARGTRGFDLNEGQMAAAERTVTSGDGVQVIEAHAGAGKTWLAGALRSTYEQAGMTVVGVAPTGRAQRELHDEAGIPSRTLAGMLLALRRDPDVIPDHAVIVIDEAGMCSTRETARLLEIAEQKHCKVVAIGDPGQLQSVQAGGWMDAVMKRVGRLRLTEVHRQRDPAERRALGALHAGNSHAYLEWAQGQERIRLDGSLESAVRSWDQATGDMCYPVREVAMIARSNETRQELNQQARTIMVDRGMLGEQRTYGGRDLAVGDRIICRQNDRSRDRSRDVDNGTKGTVVKVGRDSLDMVTDGGRTVYLDGEYVAAHVELAYALTAHGMQGSTVERAIVTGEPWELTREWAYTALSRARGVTELHALAAERVDPDRDEIAPQEIQLTMSAREMADSLARYMRTAGRDIVAVDRLQEALELEL